MDIYTFLREYQLNEGVNQSLFAGNRNKTRQEELQINGETVNLLINEFWTAGQRQASSLHEISYRACFKAQLPRFFISLLTAPDDLVYDPFMGRGTTLLEAALLERDVAGNDINPLSRILIEPRLSIPAKEEILARLRAIPLDEQARADLDLSMFYHRRTEGQLVSLRRYLQKRAAQGTEDAADRWIRMVATSRLTGHSKGFFSVYTLPPNQAVSAERQSLLNARRGQQPEYRDVKTLIVRKTYSLLKDIPEKLRLSLNARGKKALFLTADARRTAKIAAGSVGLTVTSPPFLDVVQYARDNWLRCWFNNIDETAVEQGVTMAGNVAAWTAVMEQVFSELYRVTRDQGWVAFEVGEVRGGSVRLEEHVIPAAARAGFHCRGVLINEQHFTKTANIWGVRNNEAGTNSNRVVLLQKTGK
ncbi:MAG: DNA methyltransferase [Bacillota bacterium]